MGKDECGAGDAADDPDHQHTALPDMTKPRPLDLGFVRWGYARVLMLSHTSARNLSLSQRR
ncbi:hypothetical protein CA984_09835 [Streptosporangium minutum]|uniref:Uncharacterized protein n=1 Tax=Streptosporangium minutum TaxID=569862 RepID=A0A243RRS8_9ACTN|nr:hypothetical protein CA984_09835 [Streptosporangium minutum]